MRKLILNTPLGLKVPPQGYTTENMKFPGFSSFRMAAFRTAWGKFGPFDLARKMSHGIQKRVIEKFIRYDGAGKTEAELLAETDYFLQIQMR